MSRFDPRYIFNTTGTGSSGYVKVPGFSHGVKGLIHAFSTRPDPAHAEGSSNLEDSAGIRPIFREIPPIFLTDILMATGGEKCAIYTVQQVHSNGILYLWRRQSRYDTPVEADGLVTNQKGLLLGVKTADCLPVLLVDPEAGCVAAVHAGWRGTVKGIAGNAVESMISQGRSEPQRIRAVLGPAIGPCCYEVGPEVIDKVRDALPKRWKEAVVDQKRLSLAAANRLMLEEAGLSPDRIFEVELCTCCNRDLFHSYRRDGSEAGRQIALIGLKPDFPASR